MADERVVISFETENVPRTRSEIDSLQQGAIGGFTELLSSFELFKTALAGVQSVASGLYSVLIDSNEKLNAELLKSQTNLASNLEIYRNGSEIVNITEKITSTQETLRQSLKQIEQDTKNLVGVTTEQVNGVFQVLLQNSQKFIGQSKEFSDPIEAATASTKNWAAALGTLGIPLEQANQEIRSILQGDVNNPDSIIAKTLQISREQYDQWVANGELIDQLNNKLEVFAAGNALAANSVAGITSNLKSLFEDTARLVGAPLLQPVVDSLNDIYKILNSNIKLIEQLAGENVQQLVDLFETLRSTTELLGKSLNIDPQGFLKGGSEVIGNLIEATGALVALGGQLVALIGDDLSYAFQNVVAVTNFTLEGITKLANLLTIVTKGVGDFLESVRVIPGLNLGDVFGKAQEGVAKLTGEFDQSIEAVATYASVTDVLLAQADKLTKSQNASAEQVKGQIEQLEAQKKELGEVKTYREADAKAVEGQVAAIDKAIAGLQGMTSATNELTFKSKELEDLGGIYESLGAKAEAAISQIASEGSGDATVFKESVATLTELTEKQVEYGQITIVEAQKRLEAILNNNKVEIDQREATLNTLKGLEQDFTDFKVAQLQAEIDAIGIATDTGQVTEREGLDQTYAKENQQLIEQIALIDTQIARNVALGLSTEKLALDKQNLLNDQLAAQVAYGEDANQLQQDEADRYYETAIATIEKTEIERTTALTKGLASRQITEEQFNQQSLELTKSTLQAKLDAELSNQAALQATLKSSGTVEQQRAIQAQIDQSKVESANLTKQIADAELSSQQAVTQGVVAGVASRRQAVDDSFANQELQLRQSVSNEAEVQAQLGQLTIDRIKGQLDAEIAAQKTLEGLGDTQGVEESLRKQTQLKLGLIEAEKQAEQLKEQAIQEGIANRLGLVDTEFTQRELLLRQSEKDEGAYQTKLLQLNIERIKTQLEAELAAQAELANIGDTGGVEASLKKQTQLKIGLIEAELQAEANKADIIQDGVAKRLDSVAGEFALRELKLKQSVTDEEQVQQKLLQLNIDRINSQIEAEEAAQKELAAIGDTGGVEASIKKQTQLKLSLIEAEKSAEQAKEQVILAGIDRRQQALEAEFSDRELRLRQSTSNEEEYQAGLAKLNMDRLKAQIAAETEVQTILATLGDTRAVEESKNKQRQLAISLINSQIAAEKQLQDEVKKQLEEYKKRLGLQQQSANVSLLGEEIKLQQAVIAGTVTKEQAELAKLEITKRRVQEELKVLKQLEGQGDEAEQLANQEAIARAKLEELAITQQIQGYGKSTISQAEKISIQYEAHIAKQQEIAASVAHINQLFDLQAQSVQRVNELRASQVNLANAQIATLSTGLGNELSLTDKALQARQQLTKVVEQLSSSEEISAEQRASLLAEETALKAQLNILGVDGQKSEKELLIQKQQIQQQQLQAQQAQFDIEVQQQALLIEQQRASLELDLVKANNKAQELKLEAELLAIKADQLRAEAAATTDIAKRNSLLQQAGAIDNQSARTLELAEAQTEAAQKEAEVKRELIDQQEVINQLQNEGKQDSLDTQQTLLDAQQAYEASLKGIKPAINSSALDDFGKKLSTVKRQFEDAIDVKNIPINVNLPVTVTPANLDVRVSDNDLSSSVNKLSSTLGSQTSAISSVKTTVSGLGGKLDALKRAVETNSGGSGNTQTVTTKPVVNTNLVVNVDKSGNVTVDTASLLGERASEGGC
jgi:hypothetical protein